MADVEELTQLPLTVLPSGVVPICNLPPSGNTWLARKELIARITELVGLFKRDGSRPNNRKISLKDV